MKPFGQEGLEADDARHPEQDHDNSGNAQKPKQDRHASPPYSDGQAARALLFDAAELTE